MYMTSKGNRQASQLRLTRPMEHVLLVRQGWHQPGIPFQPNLYTTRYHGNASSSHPRKKETISFDFKRNNFFHSKKTISFEFKSFYATCNFKCAQRECNPPLPHLVLSFQEYQAVPSSLSGASSQVMQDYLPTTMEASEDLEAYRQSGKPFLEGGFCLP